MKQDWFDYDRALVRQVTTMHIIYNISQTCNKKNQDQRNIIPLKVLNITKRRCFIQVTNQGTREGFDSAAPPSPRDSALAQLTRRHPSQRLLRPPTPASLWLCLQSALRLLQGAAGSQSSGRILFLVTMHQPCPPALAPMRANGPSLLRRNHACCRLRLRVE